MTNGSNNRILTSTGTDAMNAEENLTFDGSALSLTGTLTVGVDDTGHDVKFFGATTGAYMLWDESEDDFIVRRGQIKVLNNSDVVNFLVNTNGNVTLGGDLSVGDDIKLTSDSSIINFGANDEITLTHVHNSGLTLTNTITSDNTPVVFQLKSEEDAITANEVIGSLEFAAGDSDGTDGATVAAGIHAIAENTFTASANPTKLVFTTGVSETASASATAKMTLSSAGVLTTGQISVGGHIIPTADVTYDLGNASYQFKDLYLSGSTIHLGNTSLKTDGNGDIEFVDKSNNNTRRKLVADEIILGTGANRLVLKKNSSTNRLEMKNRDDDSNVSMIEGFILEDGDGTEVRITDNKEVKFIDGNGIDINWTDASHGTDGDPYDLSFSLSADQTTITSVCNSSLKIGTATDQEYINFGTSNEVNTFVNDTEILSVTGSGVNITGTITGDTSLTLDSTTITTAEIGVLNGVSNSRYSSCRSKALVLDSSGNITGIENVGCGAITSSGNLAVTGTITGDTSLTLDSTTITTAELGILDSVTAGTASASKALVLDTNKDLEQ